MHKHEEIFVLCLNQFIVTKSNEACSLQIITLKRKLYYIIINLKNCKTHCVERLYVLVLMLILMLRFFWKMYFFNRIIFLRIFSCIMNIINCSEALNEFGYSLRIFIKIFV
jgi:hypothetical protein